MKSDNDKNVAEDMIPDDMLLVTHLLGLTNHLMQFISE